MRMTGVRSTIVAALLVTMMAASSRAQDTTGAAPHTPAPRPASTATPPPAAPPVRPDSTAAPAPAPTHADSAAAAAAAKVPPVPLDSVPQGRVLLYVFNGSGRSLLGGKIAVKCDGKKIADLPRTSFSVVTVDPGKRKLQTGSGGGKLDLDAEAGHRYFILAAYWPEKSWGTASEDHPLIFDLIEEARARTLIPRAKRNEAPRK